MIGTFCIIRTFSAGVHIGIVEEVSYTPAGAVVVLKEARRLWQWQRAFTLNEIANNGCGEESRISESVDSITLFNCIEAIPCTKKAEKNLSRTRNN